MALAPKTNKSWAKEINQALTDAEELWAETEKKLGQTLPNRLFVSVPVLAMKNRNIDFKSREDAINFGCESVVSMLREFPSLQAQPKCCFVHVHIDTHLFLKLYQQSKREDLFYFLESKQVIES